MDPPAQTGSAAPEATPPKRSPEEVAREVLASREARVFRPSTERFDPRRVELPDDFFEPSAEELSAAVRSMAQGAQRMADAPLMTKKMRDELAAKRMSRFRKVLIRVLLPDRVAVQGIFEPASTIRQVQRFVRAALRDPKNVRFHLFVVPPKMKLTKLDATLWSEGLVPAALVHIGIEEGPTESQQLLKDALLEVMEDTPALAPPQPPPAPPADESKPERKPAAPPKKSSSKKIPKWFRK